VARYIDKEVFVLEVGRASAFRQVYVDGASVERAMDLLVSASGEKLQLPRQLT
jgi:hypothetical protein